MYTTETNKQWNAGYWCFLRNVFGAVILAVWLVSCQSAAAAYGATTKNALNDHLVPPFVNHNFISKYEATPKTIQRRFMWKDMGDTVDKLMEGAVSGAKVMKQMISGSGGSHRHISNNDHSSRESTKVKYIIKGPSSKKIKVIKIHSPKKTIQIRTLPKPYVKSIKTKVRYPSEEEMRLMEKQQELAVEGHLHNQTTDGTGNEIISGKISEFGMNWGTAYDVKNFPGVFSTVKPFALSELHTNVVASLPDRSQIDSPTIAEHKHSYEVTEEAAEESVAVVQSHAIRPRPPPAMSATPTTTTTEEPNYPQYFLKKIKNNAQSINFDENQFKPNKLSLSFPILKDSAAADSGRSAISIPNIVHLTTKKPFYTQDYSTPNKSQTKKLQTNEPWIPTFKQKADTGTQTKRLSSDVSIEKVATTRASPIVQTTTTTKPKVAAARRRPRDNFERGTIKFGEKLPIE